MSAQHTPGPWRVVDRDVREAHEITSRHILAGEKGKEFGVCKVGWIEDADRETQHANARLIAAAPEMLAVLQLFVKQWNACGPNSDFGRYFRNVRDAANAVIAKAEGRS